MSDERLQILDLPESRVILKPRYLYDVDHVKLLESHGMSIYEQEDFPDGNQSCYTEVNLGEGESKRLVLSLLTKQRGIKGPTTTLFVPKDFENLPLDKKEVSLAFLFMQNQGPINLRFESVISEEKASELAAFIEKTRGNINVLYSAYGADFNKKAIL